MSKKSQGGESWLAKLKKIFGDGPFDHWVDHHLETKAILKKIQALPEACQQHDQRETRIKILKDQIEKYKEKGKPTIKLERELNVVMGIGFLNPPL